MPAKEAKARIKINKLLEESGWRLLDTPKGKANVIFESNTKITEKLINDLGEDFESVLAQAEVDFIIGPQGRIKLGFIRDFVDSFFSNFYVRNEGYVGWDQMFAGVFLVGLKLGVGYLQFATLYTADGTFVGGAQVTQNPRNDIRVTGTVFSEYRLKDWLGFNLTLTYEQNITDFTWQSGFAPAGQRAENYWKLIALGGARVIW